MPVPGRPRAQLAHALDGRYGAMDPAALDRRAGDLVAATDLRGVDLVLGIPEGGSAPAYAFARHAALPLVLASRFANDEPGTIHFTESHVGDGHGDFSIIGLGPGDRVLLAEDEITTGHTVIACVRALRRAGVAIDSVATFLAIHSAPMRERLEAEHIEVVVGEWLSPALLAELGVDSP